MARQARRQVLSEAPLALALAHGGASLRVQAQFWAALALALPVASPQLCPSRGRGFRVRARFSPPGSYVAYVRAPRRFSRPSLRTPPHSAESSTSIPTEGADSIPNTQGLAVSDQSLEELSGSTRFVIGAMAGKQCHCQCAKQSLRSVRCPGRWACRWGAHPGCDPAPAHTPTAPNWGPTTQRPHCQCANQTGGSSPQSGPRLLGPTSASAWVTKSVQMQPPGAALAQWHHFRNLVTRLRHSNKMQDLGKTRTPA